MAISPKFRSRGAAVITALVTTLIALPGFAFAAPGCGTKDPARFRSAINAPIVEATPAYLLMTAERFLAGCPDRTEARDAYLIAARAALDSGKPGLAARYYAAAIERGAYLDPVQRLDHAAALMASGLDEDAIAIRNGAINAWLGLLGRQGRSSVKTETRREGVIHEIRFTRGAPGAPVQAIWLALPERGGLPSAIILHHDPMRAALRALTTGEAPTDLIVLEARSCRASEIIRESDGSFDLELASEDAHAALGHYLKRPERLRAAKPGEPVATCFALEPVLSLSSAG